MSRYVVTANDCCGEFDRRECDDFHATLAAAVELGAKYPRMVVDVCNYENADYDTNGLTEDERDALDAVRP